MVVSEPQPMAAQLLGGVVMPHLTQRTEGLDTLCGNHVILLEVRS